MKQFVTDYVKGCAQCQANKANTHKTRPPLYPIKPQNTFPFETIPSILSLNSLSQEASTPYSPSLTMTAPKQHCLFPAEKKSMDQEWPNSTLDTYSPTMVYLKRLSLIEILDLHPTSHVNYANSLISNKTSAPPIILTPIDNQNALISSWNRTFTSGAPPSRMTGQTGFPSPNSP